MQGKVLYTPVDTLVDLVKNNKNCTIKFLKNSLKLSEDIVEKWIVVLEEFKVIKVHYKGFEGYVEFVEKQDKKKEEESIEVDRIKERFVSRSKARGIGYERMKKLWPIFLQENQDIIKKEFYNRSVKMGYEQNRIDMGWKKYWGELETF